jgi:hypothetical protein
MGGTFHPSCRRKGPEQKGHAQPSLAQALPTAASHTGLAGLPRGWGWNPGRKPFIIDWFREKEFPRPPILGAPTAASTGLSGLQLPGMV